MRIHRVITPKIDFIKQQEFFFSSTEKARSVTETTTAKKGTFTLTHCGGSLLASICKPYYWSRHVFCACVFLKDSHLSIVISRYFRILIPFEIVFFEFDFVKFVIEQSRNEIGSLSFCPS